jgi:CBS domain-containing protein
MMTLRDILQVKGNQVYTVRADQTVQEAVGILMQYRVGALLVVDAQGSGVGLISERDILRECLHRSDQLGRISVRDAMTRDVIIGLPDDDISHAMSLMTNNRVRHLPVMDGGALAGLVSIGDVVKAMLNETEHENHYLKEYMFGR